MEECERLFCETLRTVFLVEKNTGFETSLLMDLRNNNNNNKDKNVTTSCNVPIPQSTVMHHGQPTPSPSPDGRNYPDQTGLLRFYVEVWCGTIGFRGFVAEKGDMRTMFIFFDRDVVGMDLKQGCVDTISLATQSHANHSSNQARVPARAG